jgi:hypothetical protein
MIWLIVAYVAGILPATVAVAAYDELTSDRGQVPPALHLITALAWPFALLVALVCGLIRVSSLPPSRLGRRIAKKHKLKKLKKERDGI